MPTTRKQTPAQARKSAIDSDFSPLYAVAGLTDVAVATVKVTLAHTQERAAKRVEDLKAKPAQQADDLARFISTLPEQLKSLPDETMARLAEVQKQAESYLTEASSAYADLAGRGKRAVDEAFVHAKQFSTKAEKRADNLRDDVEETLDPAFEQVQETVTRARKATTGRSATATTTPRSAAKATATRQASTARKTATAPGTAGPAKKTTPRKRTTKSTDSTAS